MGMAKARIKLTREQEHNATMLVRAGLAAGVQYRCVEVMPDGAISVHFGEPVSPNQFDAVDFTFEANGKVYIIGFEQWVKIGFTCGDVRTRMSAIQTSLPVALTLLASVKGTFSTEKMLHQRFAEYRASGEWFRREGALAAWIEEGCPI